MAQATTHTDAHGDGHHDDAHSPAHYVKIWAVLLVLLALSIAGPEVAPMFGSAQLVVMLLTAFGIAFVKAWLVIKHFMHLTVEKPIAWYMLITCLVFLVLFFAGVAPDVMNHHGTNWTNVAAKAEIARAMAEHEAGGGEHGQEGDHGTTNGAAHIEVVPPVVAPEPAKPAAFADMKTDGQKKMWLMKRGEEVYASAACVTCHRANGAGHGPFPPIAGQQERLGDCAKTLGVIANGMAEPIEINGTLYEQPMPPTKGLSGEDAAAVATYVRNSWGNDGGICAP